MPSKLLRSPLLASRFINLLLAASQGGGGGGVALSVVRQVFTSSGTYTPTSGMVYCLVQVQAPGGGSGGADGVGDGNGVKTGGGGGGEYAEGIFSAATIGSSQTVTIGAVGAAGNTTGGNGGTGGTTSLGALITAIGGSGSVGATTAAASAGGAGGTGGSGGDFRIPGQRGGSAAIAFIDSVDTPVLAGDGGDSFMGKGAKGGGDFQDFTAVAGHNYGGGASGAGVDSTTGVTGAAGGAGIIIVTEFVET